MRVCVCVCVRERERERERLLYTVQKSVHSTEVSNKTVTAHPIVQAYKVTAQFTLGVIIIGNMFENKYSLYV